MAGATYVLDKTYIERDAAGVGQYLAVIPAATDGSDDAGCKLPTADAGYAVGITQESQAKQNENVTVRKYGISRFKANGTITPGAALEVKGTDGRLQAATLTAGSAAVHFILGFSESYLTDGQIGFMTLSPHYVSVPAS